MPWEFEERMTSGEYARWGTEHLGSGDDYGSDSPTQIEVPYVLVCPACKTEILRVNKNWLFAEVEKLKHDPPARLCPACRKAREDWQAADLRRDKQRTILWAAIGLPVIVVFGALLFGWASLVGAPHRAARLEEPQLQGKWRIVALTIGGFHATEEMLRSRSFEISGASIDGQFDHTPELGLLKLDAHKTPSYIDITFETGPTRGKTLQGIYKLDGNTLTVSLAGASQQRPAEFASPEGSGVRLFVAQRMQ